MTNLDVRVNYVDADVNYATTPTDYITLDLTNDYLISVSMVLQYICHILALLI